MKRNILFLTLLLTTCLTSVQAKTLVAYYSYTGNCEKIANALASQITADLLEHKIGFPFFDPTKAVRFAGANIM